MVTGPRQQSPYRLTPLSARLFPRGVPRGPPHSEPTLRRAPYHPEDILEPLTRLLRCVLLAFGFEDPDGSHGTPSYFMHFAMWRGQTLETCLPSKDISSFCNGRSQTPKRKAPSSPPI